MRMIIVLMTVAGVCGSCSKPAAGPRKNARSTFQVDTVAYSQVKSADSSSLYLNVETEWGDRVDTARADSLAGWFLRSRFKIADMWIPATEPVCTRPYRTYGYVFVRLEKPDSLIDTLGFVNSPPPIRCFPKWIHYKFVRPDSGA